MTLSPALICTAVLILGVGPADVQAQERPPLPVAPTIQRAIELPITLDGTHVLVEGVRINGQGPYRFLLDTGAQGAGRADVSLVQALNLPQVGIAGASDGGSGPRRELTIHGVETLELGGLVFRDLDMVSRDYNAGGGRMPIAGVLGVDLFRGGLLTIDYGRSVIRIEPGALPEADGRTVVDLIPNAPTPAVTLSLGGVMTPARIDTGSMGAITVGQATADTLKFSAPPVVASQARTVSGAFDVLQGRLDGALVLGGLRVENPSISIIPHFRDANVGGDFLRAYVVTLDLANHRMRLTPAAGGGAPQPRRYGLMMTPPRGGETELVLNGVAPDSPAMAGGMRSGDRIVSLNGSPVAELGARLPQMMRASPLVVGFIRDGERREVTLRLD